MTDVNTAVSPDGGQHYDESHIHILQEVTQCSRSVAAALLADYKGDVEKAVSAALELNDPTVLCVGMVTAQFEAFCDSLKQVHTLFPRAPASKLRGNVRARRVLQMDIADFVKSAVDTVEAARAFIEKEIVAKGLNDVVGVFALGDGFVPLCDHVNALLGPKSLFGNSLGLTDARRDKFLMQDVLAKNGVACARSVRCQDAAEAIAALREGRVSLPVVVKPTTGAGTEFVTQCSTEADVVTAINHCRGLETTQVTKIDAFCVQEFLQGNEYVVDVVSFDGVHVVTDVWRSFKQLQRVKSNRVRRYVNIAVSEAERLPVIESTTFVYDRQEFVKCCHPSVDPEAFAVTEYILRCLDALEFRNGSSHSEVMFTADGPRLIEVNPRQQGDVPRSGDLVGYDQQTLTAYMCSVGVAALSSETEEPKLWPPPGVPQLYEPLNPSVTKHVIFFNVLDDGVVSERGKQHIRSLRSFQRFTRCTIDQSPMPGRVLTVEKTHDIFSCPGAVLLLGEDSVVAEDGAVIRKMENGVIERHQFLRDAAAKWAECVTAAMKDLEERRAAATSRGDDPTALSIDASLLDFKVKQLAEVLIDTLDPPPLFVSNEMFAILRAGGLLKILRPS